MKWSVATKIGTAFAGALVVLVLGGVLTYYTTERLIEAGNSLEHGQQVIDVLSLVVEMEDRRVNHDSRTVHDTHARGVRPR